MYTLYYMAAYMYMGLCTFLAPVMCILSWLSFLLAKKKRLHIYTHWLLPSAIGSSLSSVGFLLTEVASFLRWGGYRLVIVGNLLLSFGLVVTSITFWRVWQTVKAHFPASAEPAVAPQGEPVASPPPPKGVWPPPPQSPA